MDLNAGEWGRELTVVLLLGGGFQGFFVPAVTSGPSQDSIDAAAVHGEGDQPVGLQDRDAPAMLIM